MAVRHVAVGAVLYLLQRDVEPAGRADRAFEPEPVSYTHLEFERVGGYYMLGEELSEQGYHASYVYCDAQMMELSLIHI